MTPPTTSKTETIWTLVRTERLALIADLERLPTETWNTPSLCPGWSVHDVAAHLIDNAMTTPGTLLRAMARAQFDFDQQNQNGVDAHRGATPQETLERLSAVSNRRTGPPLPRAAAQQGRRGDRPWRGHPPPAPD